MTNTDYINNLENTIANLKKELEKLLNKKEEEMQSFKKKEEFFMVCDLYCEHIIDYCEINNISQNTIITDEFLKYSTKNFTFKNMQILTNISYAQFLNLKNYVDKMTFKKAWDRFKIYCCSAESDNLYKMRLKAEIQENKYEAQINSLQKELICATASLEAINLLKDIKQLLTKNE